MPTDEMCEPAGAMMECRRPTLSDNLAQKEDRLKRDLSDVTRARELLEKNPELRELFDIVTRVRGI
jgi:hypothetical protein